MARIAAILLSAALLAGCAAPSSPSPAGEVSDLACTPAFRDDGSLRRDPSTDAPLFVAPAGALAARAPRFEADGTVCRDPETGAPLYEEVAGGEVIRVLVGSPR
jgi:hypothetical protein